MMTGTSASSPSYQSEQIEALLAKSGWAGAQRRHLAGDASLRTFETVAEGGRNAVLMRWPFTGNQVPDAVRSYMTRVHLAQDCRSVLAIGQELRAHGFRAPEVFAADIEAGLILSEDLGRTTLVEHGRPVEERYHAAAKLLARLHGEAWPEVVKISGNTSYQVPVYTSEALIAEASLFLDWYYPELAGEAAPQEVRTEFEALWKKALSSIRSAETGWVLRDFHSPNLLWQPAAAEADRIGLIDFQDTVIGPVAYDAASLFLDARTDISVELESALRNAYVACRVDQNANFDVTSFDRAYGVMALQRITKILGIFVRLARRDNKPGYLGHLPRMQGYLQRVLDSGAVPDLKEWYLRYAR
ncbi:hypothetical protein E1180_10325 [Roseibium denhamense]|uniref:Predicted phosphotransferase, aminoglycoside/choline kinase (APH/ChoK) family n=1 Tax=Roseibium denhamense TaxID=76305 RepID=A0ABY1PKZ6_9HYPH|nr:phosphotransferase [Roseibium denhamense]MTI05906.1 hypothetical protein [Roseibium denhamense]SMP35726.1 Predicted phosphotransferase, aminoglycoside/choline kinase (APH/ChoK) family [Roseibium denhamense]